MKYSGTNEWNENMQNPFTFVNVSKHIWLFNGLIIYTQIFFGSILWQVADSNLKQMKSLCHFNITSAIKAIRQWVHPFSKTINAVTVILLKTAQASKYMKVYI